MCIDWTALSMNSSIFGSLMDHSWWSFSFISPVTAVILIDEEPDDFMTIPVMSTVSVQVRGYTAVIQSSIYVRSTKKYVRWNSNFQDRF